MKPLFSAQCSLGASQKKKRTEQERTKKKKNRRKKHQREQYTSSPVHPPFHHPSSKFPGWPVSSPTPPPLSQYLPLRRPPPLGGTRNQGLPTGLEKGLYLSLAAWRLRNTLCGGPGAIRSHHFGSENLNRGAGGHAVGAGFVLPLALPVVVVRYGAGGVHHRGAVAAQHKGEHALCPVRGGLVGWGLDGWGGQGYGLRQERREKKLGRREGDEAKGGRGMERNG